MCFVIFVHNLLQKNTGKTSEFIKKSYLAYFGIRIDDQERPWAPYKVCIVCYTNLHEWSLKKISLSFGFFMIKRETTNHLDDSYFCIINTKGFNANSKSKFKYPVIQSETSFPHSDDFPVPVYTRLCDRIQSLHSANADVIADVKSKIIVSHRHFFADVIYSTT